MKKNNDIVKEFVKKNGKKYVSSTETYYEHWLSEDTAIAYTEGDTFIKVYKSEVGLCYPSEKELQEIVNQIGSEVRMAV